MRQKGAEIKRRIMHVLGGTVLTEDVFLKNTRFLFVLFLIGALYIWNRYSCTGKMTEIEKYRTELKDAKYEALTISSELTSLSRQSRVQTSIGNNGLGLKPAKEPVYKLERNNTKE